LAAAPLFPDAIDLVTRWLDSCGSSVAQRRHKDEQGQRCRSWHLSLLLPELEGTHVSLVLPHDFPLKPARLELDRRFCLRLPHIEADGNLCHGVMPHANDIADPVPAVQRVLARFDQYVNLCRTPGWLEAEFHRERGDYWARHAAATRAPAAYRTSELLLDVDVAAGHLLEQVPAIALAGGSRALATTSTREPEALAKARGWPVGTIIRGAAAVLEVPAAERWTPSTWPRSFLQLDELLSQLSGKPKWLSTWLAGRWPNKAPLFVVLLQGTVAFGWRVMPAHFGRASQPVLLPLVVSRIDRQWSLCRDHEVAALNALSSKTVAVFGAGSLGAPVVEFLARAGVGTIDVVDPQTFEAENISRHSLGAHDVGAGKAEALRETVLRDVPGAKIRAHPVSAATWLGMAGRGRPDLVIDCSGEAAVRVAMSELRATVLGGAAAMAAWMEPQCAAAHVVLTMGDASWPRTDPVETAINIAQWPPELQVQLPGCSRGFHPYGMADAARAAGLVGERALAVLKGQVSESAVWSLVRNRRYFVDVTPQVRFNRNPPDDDEVESLTLRRPWSEVAGQ
jgi:hypothetical protein